MSAKHCSFCRKSEREVSTLIAGDASVYICNECVRLSLPLLDQEREPALYVSSRVAHLPMWARLRAGGMPIISTWINHAKTPEDFSMLWRTIEREIQQCSAFVLYVMEPDDFPLKGALVEVGMALTAGRRVFVALEDGIELEGDTFRPLGSWIKHPGVTLVHQTNALDEALRLALAVS